MRALKTFGLGLAIVGGLMLALDAQSTVTTVPKITGVQSGSASGGYPNIVQTSATTVSMYDPAVTPQTQTIEMFAHRNPASPTLNFLKFFLATSDENKLTIGNTRAGTGTAVNYIQLSAANLLFNGEWQIAGGRLKGNGGSFRPIGERTVPTSEVWSERLTMVDGGARPACAAATRGVMWIDEGGAGVKDIVAVCAKDVADAYDWRVIY